MFVRFTVWHKTCEGGAPMSDRVPADVGRRSVLIPDAAQALGLSRRTIYYRIRAGRLLTIRTRCGSQRVLWSSIEALMREGPSRRRGPVENDDAL
jgi:predicted DNA-binding transcriptional regulator AlpA